MKRTGDGIIILAVLGFGLLVLVHELGHFLAAKAAGVTVREFTIGFGPAILKRQVGDTLYALRVVPFGGATIMEGEDGESDREGSFQKTKVGRRISIVLAGSVMNLLLGLLILLLLFAPVEGYIEPRVESLMDGFPYAGETGFMPGDRIRKVNGTRIFLYDDLLMALDSGEGKPYTFELERDGKRVLLNDLPLAKKEYTSEGKSGTFFGFRFYYRQAGVIDKLRLSFYSGVNFVRMVFMSLGMLFSGKAGLSDMAGPVAITSAISDVASQSLPQAWYFLAFISVNLGVMNLLPLPALDGGRMMFLLFELVRGKPVNPKYESLVHGLGFALFVALLVLVTFNDILRLVTGGRTG